MPRILRDDNPRRRHSTVARAPRPDCWRRVARDRGDCPMSSHGTPVSTGTSRRSSFHWQPRPGCVQGLDPVFTRPDPDVSFERSGDRRLGLVPEECGHCGDGTGPRAQMRAPPAAFARPSRTASESGRPGRGSGPRRPSAGSPNRRIRFPFRGQDGSVRFYLEKPRGRRRKDTSPNGRRRGGTSTNGCPMSRQVTRARHRMGSLVLGRREATTLYANGPAAWWVEASTRVWWVMPSQAPSVRGSP